MGKYQAKKHKHKRKLRRRHKKLKGVKYIAYKLIKYFGKKYPTYSSSLPRAKELKAEMDSRGMKVGVISIFELQRVHRIPREIPYIDSDLTSPDNTYYFGVVNLLNDLATKASNEIWFKSEVPGTEDLDLIQGGTEIPEGLYENFYKNFVRFIDIQRKDNLLDYADIRILCTEPEYDRAQKKWISKIVVTDAEGNYGKGNIDIGLQQTLNAFESDVKYIEPFISPQDYEKKPKAGKAGKPDDSAVELAKVQAFEKIELEKQKNLQLALQMVMSGQMTWERYDELIARLYPDK